MKLTALFFILFFFVLSTVQAFCIYNDTPDNYFWIRQMPENTSGDYTARFQQQSVAPGTNACCNYKNNQCNHSGDPGAEVQFAFRATVNGHQVNTIGTVTAPAGGWLEFHGQGSADNYKDTIKAFNADGSPYVFEYRPSGLYDSIDVMN